MDPSLLQQFRQQLASWIGARMETQRLPFQRLEMCPRIMTDQGRLVPDLVLWINRDSQLAGSFLLLPDRVDAQVCAAGTSLARALGLGHFTTWAAREVSIWRLAATGVERMQSYALPPANRVTAEDFQRVLKQLLEQLKVVSVSSAPAAADYTVHYFANLCLRNLQELAPGLAISARMAAGQTGDDQWLEQAPREKAWMCLWRILFLLWRGSLPPGLQPERLELAIHYALAEVVGDHSSWLALQSSEPPLPEGDAVRLHHLAGRLRQLGWPHSEQQALELVNLLLHEAAHRFGIEAPRLPWPSAHVVRWVACSPPVAAPGAALVAARPYLAGRALQAGLQQRVPAADAETLQALDATQLVASAIAVLHDQHPLERKEREARLLRLRQVWPSRRFELPRLTPAWLWDALYLAGLTSEELSLTLPHNWYGAPGILSLWTTLTERFQLAAAVVHDNDQQSLHLVRRDSARSRVLMYRQGQIREIAAGVLSGQPPGAIQFWLRADEQLVQLRYSHKLTGVEALGTSWSTALAWGVSLYLRTRLGSYLWQLCSGQLALPDLAAPAPALQAAGVPVPNAAVLADLARLGSAESQLLPDPELLAHEFSNIFGALAELPAATLPLAENPPKMRRRSSVSASQVAEAVFVDGIPRFPEHYLMAIYRPHLVTFELGAPLEIVAEFFDRISLASSGRDQLLEVSGRVMAEALILASYSGQSRVALPDDEELLAELLARYRADLQQLWEQLVRECRRVEPQRLAAVRLARKIWQQQGLPPATALRAR